MERKGDQQLFYILNPPVSRKQYLLAEEAQCFARVPSGSTPQQPMKPMQRPAGEAQEPSPEAEHEASSPMAGQTKAAQELTLPAQVEMLKGCFSGSCEPTSPLGDPAVWLSESCSRALGT